MTIRVVNNTGNGSLGSGITEYSYSEEVTSLTPENLSGGAGQVSVSAKKVETNKEGNTHPNSLLLINNTMTLEDSLRGSVQFQVRQANTNEATVSITGNTVMWRLNVERTAGPHGGPGEAPATLMTALTYYCGLVDIVPVVDPELEAEIDAIPVNFIGWTGNVWEKLKELCASVSISLTDNVGLEMFIDNDALTFRKAKTSALLVDRRISAQSISVDTIDAAQSVDITNYNTEYAVNRIVQEQTRTNTLFAANENVSITDSMQVEAGQTLVKRFLINGSLESVYPTPTCVEQIIPLPYSGSTGQYVVVGTDDLPIQPAQWTGQGGNLTVKLTENPNEIEITITAPNVQQIPQVEDPAKFGLAPYKIGVESSGEDEYPALYVVGTGVFFNKTTHTFLTGASDTYTSKGSSTTIDNPFITNARDTSIRGVAAAQAICGPNIVLSESLDADLPFGSTPGQTRLAGSNKFRINSVSYSPGETGLSGVGCASFADFDAIWSGKTLSDFTDIAIDGTELAPYRDQALLFNEFTVIPLMESV